MVIFPSFEWRTPDGRKTSDGTYIQRELPQQRMM